MKTAEQWAVDIMNNSGGNYKSISKCIQKAQFEAFAAGLEAAADRAGEPCTAQKEVGVTPREVILAIPNPYKPEQERADG